jgi:hypothetical protein
LTVIIVNATFLFLKLKLCTSNKAVQQHTVFMLFITSK